MTHIDLFSGFLGAGKTTLIKKLIAEYYAGQKLVLIENEFGEIGVDGGFLQEAGVVINELNSGCICCSLVGDFREALSRVLDEYAPDRILIEPSGVGKLSDVVAAVQSLEDGRAQLGAKVTVVDATKCKLYMKNFGEFFNDQVATASCIVLSRTAAADADKLQEVTALLREKNPSAVLVTTPWDDIDGKQIGEAMGGGKGLEEELRHDHHHHHHHHDDHGDCGCHDHDHHHHHDDHGDCDCHDHHHHHDHCDCGCHDHDHHHHHDHDHGDCGCHDHDHHHHHHHADDVFVSWGRETTRRYTKEALSAMLAALDTGDYGTVLRAKGIVAATDGGWLHFDYVPGEQDVRVGHADYTGRLCVIGAELDETKLETLFGLK